MIEKIGPIKNPLTVIAIFAGLAEVSGTAVLPFLAREAQQTYIWFLMAFPGLLVVLFFVTLLFKHHVLYAPDDFRSDESFKDLIVSVTSTRRLAKIDQEASEVEAAEALLTPTGSLEAMTVVRRRDFRASALLAEELVTATISSELGAPLERNVAFASNPGIILDAVANLAGRMIVVEVKYYKTSTAGTAQVFHALERFRSIYKLLSKRRQEEFEVILALVTDGDATRLHEEIIASVTHVAENYPFKTTVRHFDLESLDSQIGVELSSASRDSLRRLEQRIVGVLGTGRSLKLREVLSELGIKREDLTATASAQEALGALVTSGRIQNDKYTPDQYMLTPRP